jgi:hypothetical protein
MSINLFGDYYFDRDPMNWILQVERDSEKHGRVIKNIAYFGKPSQMGAYIAQHAALNAAIPAETLDGLISAIDNLSAIAIEAIQRKAA